MSEPNKHSWQDLHPPHPAALVYHRYTTADDRRRIRKGLEEAGRLEVRIVTVHVADESGGKTYVVDGITRLEEMEALGWQIVDEEGNWMPAIKDKVNHHRNYTHEQVRKLVATLNGARRHMTKQDLADAIVETLQIAQKTGDKNDLRKTQRSFSPAAGKRGGSTKDPLKAEAVSTALEAGSSKAAVQRALAKTKPKQKPHEHKAKLFNGQPASTVFDPEEFKGLIGKWFDDLFTGSKKKFDFKRKPEAKRALFESWFSVQHREKRESWPPTALIYEDGSQFTVKEVLKGIGLKLKTDKYEKQKPTWSVDLTDELRGGPRKQKGGAK